MMTTLLGAVVSDTLADGKVVSGVGGQYNFVAQAFALPDAAPSCCGNPDGCRPHLIEFVWEYPETTIPRHLRDIVVTEYGIADLRGRATATPSRRCSALPTRAFR